jgi:hypothetical protein
MSKEEIIKKAYYDTETGFVGINKLYEKLKGKVTKKDIKNFLDKQEVYQLNKKNNRRLNSFIPTHPKQEFQMDLIFIENPHHNNNSRYGLAVIDVFTKKAAIVLLQKKDQPSILEAVKTAFERMGVPETVYADEGSEFISAGFKNYLNENSVTLITTYSHAPFIERFNRTIKEMMDKYLQSKETKDIASVLDTS